MKRLLASKRTWLPLALILFTCLIWWNASRTAGQSSQMSGWVLEVLDPVLDILRGPEQWKHFVVRKLAHFTEYAVLGGLWAVELRTGLCRRLTAGAALRGLICLATAFVDETIQLFVPGRSGQVSDMWIDLGGSVTGICVVLLLWFVVEKLRKKGRL